MEDKQQRWVAGLGVLGLIGASLAGYVTITTPKEAQCAVELADAQARLELLTEATDACKPALEACISVIGGGEE